MKQVLIRQCQSKFIIEKISSLSPLPYFQHILALCTYFYFFFFSYLQIYSLYLPLQFHSTFLGSFSSLFPSFHMQFKHLILSSWVNSWCYLNLCFQLTQSIFVVIFCNFMPSSIVKHFPPFSSGIWNIILLFKWQQSLLPASSANCDIPQHT